VETRLVPMRIARFRLNRSAETDAKWLCGLLSQLGAPLATRYELASDEIRSLNSLTLGHREPASERFYIARSANL
jgi:hypothetical protein